MVGRRSCHFVIFGGIFYHDQLVQNFFINRFFGPKAWIKPFFLNVCFAPLSAKGRDVFFFWGGILTLIELGWVRVLALVLG